MEDDILGNKDDLESKEDDYVDKWLLVSSVFAFEPVSPIFGTLTPSQLGLNCIKYG